MSEFYNFSGGMESAAMIAIERDYIKQRGAVICFADTGKQFPEMPASIKQIAALIGIEIVTVPRRITFDEYLFERGGMLRKGTNDCSRRMKRSNLARYMKTFPPPYEVSLGFNADEQQRADEFVALNEREWLHWRFPLIEQGIDREETFAICERAGFMILVEMYKKMGRFDCFLCPNQRPSQAVKVAQHYPELAAEWIEIENRKQHSILPVPFKILLEEHSRQGELFEKCGCFGGSECFADEIAAAHPESEGA